jgi:hypothetical protein
VAMAISVLTFIVFWSYRLPVGRYEQDIKTLV